MSDANSEKPAKPAAAKKSWLKRSLIVVGSLVGVILLAIIIIPLVVNVDQYRPQIVGIVNENINGKLAIERMSLSLWGQIEIQIDGVQVNDLSGNKLLAVKQTYAQFSFLSLIKGQPRLVFRMDKPEINVIKDKTGKLNLLSLAKESPPGEPPPEPVKPSGGKTEVPLIAVIAAAGVDVELKNAFITFIDEVSGFKQEVKDFNLVLADISMSRPMHISAWADIATKVGTFLEVKGPFKLSGQIAPQFAGVEFKQANVDLALNFDDLVIDMSPTFKKDAGIATNIQTKIVLSKEMIDVQAMQIKFHNAVLEATAKLANLQTPSPSVDFNLTSNPIDLSAWDKLIVMLKEFELEGRMDVSAKASGPTSKLEYQAKVDVLDFTAKAPVLIAKPKMQINVEVETDHLKKFAVNLEAPGNDLNLQASVKSFSKPQIQVALNSNGLDLDQLLPPPKPEPAAETADNKKGSDKDAQPAPKAEETKEPPFDVDGALEPIRNNPMLMGTAANVAVRIKKFKGFKILAENINVDFSLKSLLAAIDRLDLRLWQGAIKMNANIDLKPKSPTYQFKMDMAKMDIQQAVDAQLQSLKNTMVGKLSVNGAGKGQSLNSDKLLKNLELNGSFSIHEAHFASVDVGKMVTEGINSGIAGAVAKVPPLKDKRVAPPSSFKSRYKVVSSDFNLKSGVFLAPNFKTESYPKEGIDVEGRTEVDLINDKLNATWYVIDTYNVTKARDLSVNYNGVNIESILSDKDQPVRFPVKVGCKLSEPCYDYTSVPGYFGEVAYANAKDAVSGKFKEEKEKLEKQAKTEIEKKKKELQKRAKDEQKKAKDDAKKKAKEEGKKLLKGFGL